MSVLQVGIDVFLFLYIEPWKYNAVKRNKFSRRRISILQKLPKAGIGAH